MSICDVCPVKGLGERWAPLTLPNPTRHTYEVSTEGRVRNADTGRELRAHPNVDTGYWQVNVGGRNRGCLIHRLVALTFLGPPPRDGQAWEVDHLDYEKPNNRVTNLRWLPKNTNAWRWKFWTGDPGPEDLGLHPSDPDHPGHGRWLATIRANGWRTPNPARPGDQHRTLAGA